MTAAADGARRAYLPGGSPSRDREGVTGRMLRRARNDLEHPRQRDRLDQVGPQQDEHAGVGIRKPARRPPSAKGPAPPYPVTSLYPRGFARALDASASVTSRNGDLEAGTEGGDGVVDVGRTC